MNIKSFITVVLLVFTVISCANKKVIASDEVWTINFDTSKGAGICYYQTKDPIKAKSGHFTIQNRNNFSIHVSLHNKNLKGRIDYEADIDAGGLLSYNNVDPSTPYIIGVRVSDGKGVDNVSVMIYGDTKLKPYALNNED